MKTKLILLALAFGVASVLSANTQDPKPDTITMRPVIIMGFKSKKAERQFWKDYKRIERVYPYAYKAQRIMQELNEKSAGLSNRERNQLMKSAEDQIKEYLTPKIKRCPCRTG